MTVYVDDMLRPATVGTVTAKWSHLLAGPWDDIEELHRFARQLGLRRGWFQGPPKHRWPVQHYDVTASKRLLAIRLGAVPVTYLEVGEMVHAARKRGQDNPPAPGEPVLPPHEDIPLTLF